MESLSYDEFYKWLTQNHEFSTVTRWLLEEQMSEHRIRISSDDNTPSFYSSLAKLTKCKFFTIDTIFLKSTSFLRNYLATFFLSKLFKLYSQCTLFFFIRASKFRLRLAVLKFSSFLRLRCS